MAPQSLDQRLGGGEQGFDCGTAAGADNVIGILARGERDEAQSLVGREVGQRASGGADRGFLARRIAVEAQQWRGLEPPHPLELGLGQRGAVGGDDFGDPGAVEADHIHIAFDHDHAVRRARGGGGEVEIVERSALVEQWRLGGIEILRFARPEDPPAEGDDAAARIADRDHQPPTKAVVGPSTALGMSGVTFIRADQHPCFDQFVLAERGQGGFQVAAVIGREADPETRHGAVVDSATGEIVARGGALDPGELVGEPALGCRHDVIQACRLLLLLAGSRVGRGDVHPGLARQFLDRIHERQPARVGQETDRIAMRAAAEAMVEALLVVDGERRGLLLVERAASLIFAARLGQFDRWGDDRAEGGARAEFVEELGREGHASCSPPAVAGGEERRSREGEGLSPSEDSMILTTPSIFSITSVFQNRRTRYPFASRYAVRA